MQRKNDLNYQLYLHREYGFKRTPFHQEFERYKYIQLGDTATVKKNFSEIKKDYLSGEGILSDDPIRNIRYHMIISTAITSRICVEGGMQHDAAYTLSDIYIQKADKLNSFNDILDLLEEMQIDYATRMKNLKSDIAISVHVRKCIDYIYDHLQEKLTVSVIASNIGIERSYLSKLFMNELGISVHNFLLKVRIDTAKNMLQNSNSSYISIALSLGFSSQSSFIENFKKQTQMTPKQYRDSYYKKSIYENR